MLKKGDVVVMHTCTEAMIHDGQIWVCSSDEFTSSGGERVIFLDGFSGYFLVKYLQRILFSQHHERVVFVDADLHQLKEIAMQPKESEEDMQLTAQRC